jgi:hypothetical protein
MYSALLTVLGWLKANEWLALWVEGLALLAIFIWDRKDHREDHAETIEQMKVMSRNAVAAEIAAEAAKLSAEATMESVKLQKVAMQQWIEAANWHIDHSYIPREVNESIIYVDFEIENPTKFKLILQSVEVWLDRAHIGSVSYGKMFLSPDETAYARVEYRLTGQKLISFRDSVLQCEIGAVVHFIDAFGDQQERAVGVHCKCRHRGQEEFEPISFRPPDEKELETRKRMLKQIQEKKESQ